MASDKRVTLLDIAKEAGVSHTAVSKALRGARDIGPELTARIRHLANKNNYYPRAAAQLLRGGRTNQIGIVVATSGTTTLFEGDFLGPLLGHLIDKCGRQQLRYMIETCSHDMPFNPPHLVRSGLVDGVVAVGDVGDALRQWLKKKNALPWVSIGEPADHCVLIDGRSACYEITQRLFTLGHRRVAYGGGPQRHAVHRTAFEGFLQAVREQGLEVRRESRWIELFENIPFRDAAATQVMWARAVLSGTPRPTAVFCHGETIARGVVFAATQLGLRVPQDVSVVSWGSAWVAQANYPTLTTLAVDYTDVAERAVDMLDRLVDKQVVSEPVISVMPRLIEGDTLAPWAG